MFDTPELRNGIIAAVMERMAAGDALDPQPTALDHAILFDGLIGIHRAGRLINTCRWQGRRDKPFVKANKRQHNDFHETSPLNNSARRVRSLTVRSITSKGCSTSGCRAIK